MEAIAFLIVMFALLVAAIVIILTLPLVIVALIFIGFVIGILRCLFGL